MHQRPRLSLRLRAQTRITREVQLALRYLQTPTLELSEELARTAEENPWLEIDESEQLPFTPALPRCLPEPWPEEREPLQRYEPGMHERLLMDLRLHCDPSDRRAAAEYLIGCLDERGYLGAPLAELAFDLRVSESFAEEALRLIQALDPPGIGARDLRECLLLQLERRGEVDSAAYRFVRDAWASLLQGWAGRRPRDPDAEMFEAVRIHLRRLVPHPGWQLGTDPVPSRVPDVSIEWVEGRPVVTTLERGLPRLRRDWAPGGPVLEAQSRSARWLLDVLERRRQTIVQVTRAIVEEQSGYFELGLEGLKPLTLQAIARRVGVHESTVARVAKDKYAETPRGIVPLRFFFSGGVATESGEELSSRVVEARIRSLVESEDPSAPLSDQEIAVRLESRGIRIARRTVAKYRVRMRIERAPLRRRLRAGRNLP